MTAIEEQGKSISLNWWCDTPNEFEKSVYDKCTEIYFIGKIFEKAIKDSNLGEFKYLALVREMCKFDPAERTNSFKEIQNKIANDQFAELEFHENEIKAYRDFANSLTYALGKLNYDSSCQTDYGIIVPKLQDLYKSSMLEEYFPDTNKALNIFIKGGFSYYKDNRIEISKIKSFLNLLETVPREKQDILLLNLETRINAIARKLPKTLSDYDDEIPF